MHHIENTLRLNYDSTVVSNFLLILKKARKAFRNFARAKFFE